MMVVQSILLSDQIGKLTHDLAFLLVQEAIQVVHFLQEMIERTPNFEQVLPIILRATEKAGQLRGVEIRNRRGLYVRNGFESQFLGAISQVSSNNRYGVKE